MTYIMDNAPVPGMGKTTKIVLISLASVVTTLAVSAISYVKGKRDGIQFVAKQREQVTGSTTQESQHARA